MLNNHEQTPPFRRERHIHYSSNVPIYIWAPDFRLSSAGIRVLHYFCHILNELGEEAYIANANITSPYLRTPLLTDDIVRLHHERGAIPVAVYPEIVINHPLNTPITVRWFLNVPGHLTQMPRLKDTDLIFYYDDWTLPKGLKGNKLLIHSVNHKIFHNENNLFDQKRSGSCYYAHKYLVFGHKINREHEQFTSLCHNTGLTIEQISEILRQSEVLYCYEPSGITNEALACGCPVLLVRSDYFPVPETDPHLLLPGCIPSDVPDALKIAKSKISGITETHRRVEQQSWEYTRRFLDLIYSQAKETKTEHRPNHKEEHYETYTAACHKIIREISIATISQNQAAQPKADVLEAPLFDNLITIIVSTTSSKLHLLANTLDSLKTDSVACWQLIISSNLEEPLELDGIDRIHWITADAHEDAKAKIDITVAELESTWVLELPSGATFTERLFQQLLALNHEETKAVFFDDDLYDDRGKNHSPRFKPGVNPEALRSTDLAGAICVKREHWLETGGTWQNGETPWYYKLLKVAHAYGWKSIKHVPQVLLSYAERYRSNSDACLLAIDQHLQESGSDARISLIDNDSWSILQNLPSPPPSVDVFIYTQGDLGLIERCLTSLTEITTYPNFQVGLTVDTNEADPDLEAWLDIFAASNPRARVIRKQGNESFAALANQAMTGSTADYTMFINDESVAIQKEWLDELVRACSQEGVSGASPRLLKSGTKLLENTGYVLGLNGWRAPAFCGQAKIKLPGQFDWIDCSRDITTLTSSCFIVRNSAVTLAGQMDAEKFSDQMAIADLSLRLFDSGQRLLYVPRANLAGSSELPAPLDGTLEVQMRYLFERKKNAESFQKRWWPRYANDPFWNPNLSLIENTPTPEIEYFADWFLGDEGKPKILTHVVANAQADFRVTSPLHALRKKNLVSTCVWKQRLFAAPRYHTVSELSRLNPDVHIVQHYIHDNALAAMNEWQKMRHRPFTIYALDDVITDIDPSNPFFKNFSANSRTRLKYALARCDRMVVSTDFLADLYQHLIADIRVVPNRLEMEKWLPLRSKKRTGKKPRVGWAGGTTHQRDLLLLKEVIEQTRDEADWIFFGMCPEEILPLIKETYPFVPFEDYPAFLASLNFDIAVAPLADTIFNRGKSNLRLLELGILGLPVICTDIDPYRDSPACRVDNTVNAWVSALRERIHDAEARETEGGTMRRWVTEKFLLENHLDDWLAAHMPN